MASKSELADKENETIRVCRAKSYLTNELKKFENM